MHEQTITVEMDGRNMVIPTAGYENHDAAVAALRAGKLRPLGAFANADTANRWAAERSRGAGDHRHGSAVSPDNFNMLGGALTDLYGQAQARPDLGMGRVASFLGRMVEPGEGLAGILQRRPTESPDAEGMGGIGAILAGAPIARRMGGKVFREATGPAPAVREMGGKFFTDMPTPHVAPWQEIVRDLIAEGPIPRSTLRPAIRTESGIISGDVMGGHGRLWESVSPAQRKGAIDGYIDRAGRFMTRDQGTIASGSVEGIKRAYQNALREY